MNELVPLDKCGIVVPQGNILGKVAGQEYLPRVMLMQSASELVKNEKIGQGHFALMTDAAQFIDLGDQFDALVINFRPKAIRLEGKKVVEDIYDSSHPSFDAIVNDSTERSDEMQAMYGPEFLLYLCKEKKFCTFFFSNPTLRREGGKVALSVGKAVTFQKKLIKSGSRSWFGCMSFESKTPVQIPPVGQIKEEAEKFQRPISKIREAAPAAPVAEVARAR